MAAFDFPIAPVVGETYELNGVVFTWTGEAWVLNSFVTPLPNPPPVVQIKRTETPDNPPELLRPGELAVEMGDPLRFWVGVPPTLDPFQRKLIYDSSAPVGLGEAPEDGKAYGRRDAAWSPVAGEAPSDGKTYGRRNAAWSEALPIGGGTLTGPLNLAADPTTDSQAGNKHYIDAAIAAAIAGAPPPVAVPSGTVMLFYQAAAPVGWTKVTTHNDKVLRVVSGNGGGAGGATPFSSIAAQTVTGATTLAVGHIPGGITSYGSNTITVYPNGSSAYYIDASTVAWGAGQSTPGSFWHGHLNGNSIANITYHQAGNGISVSVNNVGGAAHNHPLNLNMQYIDLILASKD
ncbi:hypothetical protein [Bradyrhizobium neotropicale]|uniref:hypothetical protein n=1 Tax=Bradyrhizobium neotropicale TaxID=1497615 RepID=UPI001AD6EFC1|nr:hypothetical protein [Bradyrhizobium neotropicale]MBO4228385.1 hypothetical protein [Bradyrhizobium neotropicale]